MSDDRVRFSGPAGRLVNISATSAGSIHDDDAARTLGFRGAFVPGSVVGTRALSAVTALLGPSWMASGSYSMTFVSPVYSGDLVRAVAESEGGPVAFRVETVEGRHCCVGIASADARPPWGTASDAADPPAVLPGIPPGFSFPGGTFAPTEADVVRLAEASGDDPASYLERSPWGYPVIPPEMLQRGALDVVRSVPLGVTGVRNPGMWAGHALAIRRPLVLGPTYELSERVAERGRSGRTVFITYEFRASVAGEEVAVGRHRVKWLADEQA